MSNNKSLTVRELIEKLQSLDPEAVVAYNDRDFGWYNVSDAYLSSDEEKFDQSYWNSYDVVNDTEEYSPPEKHFVILDTNKHEPY